MLTTVPNWSKPKMEEARSEIECLPDEVLLMIFRYLGFKDLQLAEQVCERWKAVVETRFATIKRLDMSSRSPDESDCVEAVKRCGPSLQALFMPLWTFKIKFNWINYIAEAFPNIVSLSLQCHIIENEDFRTLSIKCRQLKGIELDVCTFSDDGLPGLEVVRIFRGTYKGDLGECFSHLGGNLEFLKMSSTKEITTPGLSHLFSKCKKLKGLELIGLNLYCDELFSKWCQENVSVQHLVIGHNSHITKQSFSQISRLLLLEKLYLYDCDAIDSETLIGISRGCRNLRHVNLRLLRNICDRGVNSLSRCRNLSEFGCSQCSGVTEDSLVELSKSGRLKRIQMGNSWVSNSSCAAILGHCPQLDQLNVVFCKGVVDGIVDIAIQAIENRANGVVLNLYIEGTGVDPEKETRTHPLLRVQAPWVQDPFKSVNRIILI